MKKILSIIDTAYRATLEEQDDTGLWFNHSCINAGAKIDFLLTGNAVNYLVNSQNPPALNLGQSKIHHPNYFHQDLKKIHQTGAQIFFVKEDVEERGIESKNIIHEAEGISRAQISKLVDQYDQHWRW